MRWLLLSDTTDNHDGIKGQAGIVKSFFADYKHKIIEFNETQGLDKDARRIIEVELLAKCDELVVTGGSTFSYVAVFKTSRMPYVINGRTNMKKCVLADPGNPGYAVRFDNGGFSHSSY